MAAIPNAGNRAFATDRSRVFIHLIATIAATGKPPMTPCRALSLSTLVYGACLAIAAVAHAAEPIEPAGKGMLTICRDWEMMTESCRTYHHIVLPHSIDVGDMVEVEYGSNLKEYRFRVSRIELKDGICTILGPAPTSKEFRDSIQVACHRAEPAPPTADPATDKAK